MLAVEPANGFAQSRANADSHSGLGAELDLRGKLLRRMRTVAKARFNANQRLEDKAIASNFSLQIANLYTLAIGIYLLQFHASDIVKTAGDVLNYVSLIASVFVQIMALLESLKDYTTKARLMHDCAVKVNDLCQALELDLRSDLQTLRAYQQAYQSIVKECPINHDDIDYRSALLDDVRGKRDQTWGERAQLAWLRVRYIGNVYLLTGAIVSTPVVVLVLLWPNQ